MVNHATKTTEEDVYEIVVMGILPPELSELVAGMEIRNERISVLKGKIKDQSELMGVLNTLTQYHAKVLSVKHEVLHNDEWITWSGDWSKKGTS